MPPRGREDIQLSGKAPARSSEQSPAPHQKRRRQDSCKDRKILQTFKCLERLFSRDGLWEQWLNKHAAAFDNAVKHWASDDPDTTWLYHAVIEEFDADVKQLYSGGIFVHGDGGKRIMIDWIALLVRVLSP